MKKTVYKSLLVVLTVVTFSFACESEAFGQINASSLWLFYSLNPTGGNADMVMIDVSIDSTQLYTYYAALCWNNGYAGIQRGGDDLYKNVHFSLWDPTSGTSRLVWHAPDVQVQRFSGEGTGWLSDWGFNWQDNRTYRLLIKDDMTDSNSDYEAWFFDFERYEWKHLATFEYPVPTPITYLSSFIEPWEYSPQNYRSYSLFNVWERLYPSGVWYPIRSAQYSINGKDTNCDGRVQNNRFFLATGGSITPTNPSGTTLTIVPTIKVATENPEIKDVVVSRSLRDTIRIEWSYANNLYAPQETYRVRISKDAGLSNIVYDSGIVPSTDTVDDVAGLALDSTHTYYLVIDSKTAFDDSTTASVELTGSVVTGLEREGDPHPARFKLGQNYPNPFNPATEINFSLPNNEYVNLQIYNVLGQEVADLLDGRETAGSHSVTFDGSDLPSGVYFYRLEAGNCSETKKLMVLK